jgi:hypothetical protein
VKNSESGLGGICANLAPVWAENPYHMGGWGALAETGMISEQLTQQLMRADKVLKVSNSLILVVQWILQLLI